MEQILLPSTINFVDTDNPNIGKMVVTPCSQGYGTTLGNALRRVLLSSLPGSAVESVKITGVQHEFSTVEGVKEDVVEIILNLKLLAVKLFVDEPITLSLSKKGKGVITAKDFDKNSDVEIMNEDLVIANVTENINFEMEVVVAKGRGYVPVEKKNLKNLDLGTILIDSLYTPIRDVGYRVEMTRLGDVTDFEKLTLNIETNGTITPREAVGQATKVLMDHFVLVLDSVGDNSEVPVVEEKVLVEDVKEEIVKEEKPKKRTKKKKEEKIEE
jgi:DNA-directed RNA polymerase subunit alpha